MANVLLTTYVWQHEDTPLPDNHESVIYEMHVADFSPAEIDIGKRGKYQDVIALVRLPLRIRN